MVGACAHFNRVYVRLSARVHEQCHAVGVGAIDVARPFNPILENEAISEGRLRIASCWRRSSCNKSAAGANSCFLKKATHAPLFRRALHVGDCCFLRVVDGVVLGHVVALLLADNGGEALAVEVGMHEALAADAGVQKRGNVKGLAAVGQQAG